MLAFALLAAACQFVHLRVACLAYLDLCFELFLQQPRPLLRLAKPVLEDLEGRGVDGFALLLFVTEVIQALHGPGELGLGLGLGLRLGLPEQPGRVRRGASRSQRRGRGTLSPRWPFN